MKQFPRPKDLYLYEKKDNVDRKCPECGSRDAARYRVLSDGGWWHVVKCQNCLYSFERQISDNQYEPVTLLWKLM